MCFAWKQGNNLPLHYLTPRPGLQFYDCLFDIKIMQYAYFSLIAGQHKSNDISHFKTELKSDM